MTYDEWKTQPPPDPPDKECMFCGVPTHKTYCSEDCKRADIFDRS